MLEKDKIRKIFFEIEFLSSWKEIESDYLIMLEGQVEIKGQSVTMQIALEKNFLLKKPLYFIKPYNALGFIPHVFPNGYICYVRDEDVFMNTEYIKGIIIESFEKAKQTLIEGIEKKNHNDFMKEFIFYLNSNFNNIIDYSVLSIINVDSYVKTILVGVDKKNRLICMGDNLSIAKKYFRNLLGEQLVTNIRWEEAVYVPLREGTKIYPPEYNKFWSPEDVRKLIFKNITSSNKKN